MFKKIIIIFIVFLPVWYSIFIGYPIISEQQYKVKVQEQSEITVSKRCFSVGDFKQFTECFQRTKHIKGNELLREVTQKTDNLYPWVTIFALLSLLIFILVGIIWVITFD